MPLFLKYRTLSKNTKYLILSAAFGSIGATLVRFLFSIYLNALGLGKSDIGLIIFIMCIAATLPLIPIGYLSDKYGRIKFVFLGIFVSCIGYLILCFTENVLALYLVAIFLGCGSALYMPSFLGYLSDTAGKDTQKYLFSLHMFSTILAGGVSNFFAGMMPEFFANLFNASVEKGFRIAFFIGLLFVILQIIPLCIASSKSLVRVSVSHRSILSALKTKTILMLSLPQMFFGLGAGFIIPFFQLYFIWRFNTPLPLIGTIFAITSFIWCPLCLLVPYLAERVGSVKTIFSLQLCAILVLICIPLSPTLLILTTMYIVRMILMNLAGPIYNSYAVNIVPREYKSLTLSATSFTFSLFNAISPVAAGYIYESNINLPYYICASLYISGSLIFFVYFRRRKEDVT